MIPDGKTEIKEMIKRLWNSFSFCWTKWNKKDTAQKLKWMLINWEKKFANNVFIKLYLDKKHN